MLPNILTQKIIRYFQMEISHVFNMGNRTKITLQNKQILFAKWGSHFPKGTFSAEAHGLKLLEKAHGLQIPHVHFYSDDFIVMDWFGGGKSNQPHVAKALGEGLAKQHHYLGQTYGLEIDNFCGLTPQKNTPNADWVAFFGTMRLGFQMELAEKQGRMPTHRRRKLEKLIAKLPDLLPANPSISLLHGDLWGGNWLTTDDGQPALIDPAAYYGHRESDLAFTEVFGGFPSGFYDAYQASWALESGYHHERKHIYNLYHLLNHLNLFGESYGHGVDSILKRFG